MYPIRSRGMTVVKIQQATQTLFPPDYAVRPWLYAGRNDQPVFQSLVVSFLVIMLNEFGNSLSQRAFSK